MVDKAVGRRVMIGNRLRSIKLRKDGLCELLAQLNSPLIVRVDVPDDSLNKDLVLIHGNQASQDEGGEFGVHNGVGGFVSSESLFVASVEQLASSLSFPD